MIDPSEANNYRIQEKQPDLDPPYFYSYSPQPGLQERGLARKTAFKQGIISGGILIFVGFLLGWFDLLVLLPLVLRQLHWTITQYVLLTLGLSLVLYSIIFFFTSMYTAYLTSKVSIGIIACLWTALWQLLAFPILFWVGVLAASSALKSNPSFLQIQITLFLENLVSILAFSILGVGLGALGGLLGRSMSKQSQPNV